MGMNRKTGRGAKFLIVFVVIVIIMAAVTFFAGKYAYHLLREYIEYASKQSTEVVLEKDGLKGMIEWMSEKEKEKLPKKFLVSDIEAGKTEKCTTLRLIFKNLTNQMNT